MRSFRVLPLVGLFRTLVSCQQVGKEVKEEHPTLYLSVCTTSKGCNRVSSKVVLDADRRWLHDVNSKKDCFDHNGWDSDLCPDASTCAKDCALEGADYEKTHGVRASESNLTLLLYPGGSISPRVYVMSDDSHYRLFNLKNQELAFDVDVSGLPCGTNGALYFITMPGDGGKSLYPNNDAGAAYGTGYCDAQCPKDIKFINGEANLLNYSNGQGRYGSCCPELDVWEANSAATVLSAHPCSVIGPYRCDSEDSHECSITGICDKIGCGFNPYRMGNSDFYGSKGKIKTNSPNIMKVITRFITSDNTAQGTLVEIRRYYVQGGEIFANSISKIPKVKGNSLNDAYCAEATEEFREENLFKKIGGMTAMDSAMDQGMVLAASVWFDESAHMLWLDSTYPTDAIASKAGAARGPCGTSTGNPSDIKSKYADAKVVFSNIKIGDIGSTYSADQLPGAAASRNLRKRNVTWAYTIYCALLNLI